jgi:hypothetical protein
LECPITTLFFIFTQHGHFSSMQISDCSWLQMTHMQTWLFLFFFLMSILIIIYAHITKRNKAIMKKINDSLIPDFNTISIIPNNAKPKPL